MKKLILVLLIVPVIGIGQTKVNKRIYKKANVTIRAFDFNAPVSVSMRTSEQKDGNIIFGDGTDSNALGELENALFNQGYEVVSESTAREFAEISIEKNNSSSKSIKIETTPTKYYESVYLFEIDVKDRFEFKCGGRVIGSLSGRIINLVNSRVVGTFNLKQGELGAKCGDVVMETIANKIKNLSNNR